VADTPEVFKAYECPKFYFMNISDVVSISRFQKLSFKVSNVRYCIGTLVAAAVFPLSRMA
jgi:hypothetical protein